MPRRARGPVNAPGRVMVLGYGKLGKVMSDHVKMNSKMLLYGLYFFLSTAKLY